MPGDKYRRSTARAPYLFTWLEHEDATVVANALIVLVQRTLALLGEQLQAQESAFLDHGGVRERMSAARLAARNAARPECPECGNPMQQRHSRKGEFWGCAAYPDCRGIRDIGNATASDSRHMTRESQDAGPSPVVAR